MYSDPKVLGKGEHEMWQLNENQESRPGSDWKSKSWYEIKKPMDRYALVSDWGVGVTRPEDFVEIHTLQRCSIWTTPTGIKI